MNKKIAILLSAGLIISNSQVISYAETYETDKYIANLSAMIQKYDTDDYFSTMSVTIGEPNLTIDGETIPIDESGSVAYVENGRTMMPVRGIAEAIGAEVDYDHNTQTVTVENEDTKIAMTIGESEMQVNGQKVMLLNAPEIKAERTMLPVRDVAEALDCEVEWQQETQTATFTRAYQTKRVIVNSENADTTNAVDFFSADGKTVIQFDNIDDAKSCVESNTNKGFVAEPDYVRTFQAMSWGAEDIGGDYYYEQTDYACGSAIVAVIDTGIDYNHEVFRNRIVDGYDFYSNDNYCEDILGHGTLVASTVLDISGKNPNIKVMPLKVFGSEDNCTSSNVALAIRYATDNGASVINLSLGGQHRSEIEQEAIDYANSKNVAVVAAAGNEKLDLAVNDYSPGGLNGVITVSALDKDYSLASFSNYGEGIVEFAAPGRKVKCAENGGGYTTAGGTSLASPHVAGVYALAKAVHPNLTTDEITVALSQNAKKIGSSRYVGAGSIRVKDLEQYISKMYFSNLNVSSISNSSAVVSGQIGYNGIIPEKIGIKLNGQEIYSTAYNASKNNEMNFSYKLNSLKSGTDYETAIFTNQGGYILNTDVIKFKTTGNSDTPTPTPDPIKSELRILPEDYPIGTLKQGMTFNLSGRIKSNCHITDVRSYILDANKNVLQEASGWTTTATYVIEKSKLDTELKFEKLNSGTYYLKYYAKDETGNEISWISDVFYVSGANDELPDDNIVTATVLIPESFENLSIRTGSSTSYEIIGSMNDKEKCTVYTDKTQNGWYYVEYNGIRGYAAGNYIYLPSETKVGTVNIPSSWENLSIRTGASTDYQIIGSMNNGDKCTIFTDKTKNNWYFIEYNGIYGYASGNCIK